MESLYILWLLSMQETYTKGLDLGKKYIPTVYWLLWSEFYRMGIKVALKCIVFKFQLHFTFNQSLLWIKFGIWSEYSLQQHCLQLNQNLLVSALPKCLSILRISRGYGPEMSASVGSQSMLVKSNVNEISITVWCVYRYCCWVLEKIFLNYI